MRRLLPLLVLAMSAPFAHAGDGARRLDAHFVNDRVLVDAPLAGGDHIRFFTDSGGGATLLLPAVVERLRLPTQPLPKQGAEDLPADARALSGELPLAASAFPQPPAPAYVVKQLIGLPDMPAESDGTLGNNWFAGHVWTWNYVAGTLALEAGDWTPPSGARVVPLGFRAATKDGPALAFPRIEVTVAGVPMPMLLDTGATTVLTPDAAQRLGGPRLRATSMIGATIVAGWRKAHPDWPVVEHAQAGTGARMIEVPDVRIAGFQVGPVWFTERPDTAYSEFMAPMMDRPVRGSIGGNAFHTLAMTIDYPHARAAFAHGKP
jgi:hypothetical protein